MNIQELRSLPISVQYLIMHGVIDPRDAEKVEAAVSDALNWQLKPEDLWRIDTDRGMAS